MDLKIDSRDIEEKIIEDIRKIRDETIEVGCPTISDYFEDKKKELEEYVVGRKLDILLYKDVIAEHIKNTVFMYSETLKYCMEQILKFVENGIYIKINSGFKIETTTNDVPKRYIQQCELVDLLGIKLRKSIVVGIGSKPEIRLSNTIVPSYSLYHEDNKTIYVFDKITCCGGKKKNLIDIIKEDDEEDIYMRYVYKLHIDIENLIVKNLEKIVGNILSKIEKILTFDEYITKINYSVNYRSIKGTMGKKDGCIYKGKRLFCQKLCCDCCCLGGYTCCDSYYDTYNNRNMFVEIGTNIEIIKNVRKKKKKRVGVSIKDNFKTIYQELNHEFSDICSITHSHGE
jgi:hypothetical protein